MKDAIVSVICDFVLRVMLSGLKTWHVFQEFKPLLTKIGKRFFFSRIRIEQKFDNNGVDREFSYIYLLKWPVWMV